MEITLPCATRRPAKAMPLVMPLRSALTLPGKDPWDAASKSARIAANHRLKLVLWVKEFVDIGLLTQNKALALLVERFDSGVLDVGLHAAMTAVAKKNRARPGEKTIAQWCKDYKEAGYNKAGLLPGHRGNVRKPEDWWPVALELYNQPSNNSVSSVHRELCEVHGFDVGYDQVLGYLRSLPAKYGKNGVARMGENLHRLKEKPFISRTTRNLKPGDLWAADGYKADVYLAHPVTGGIWRPELTVAIDVRSRYPVNWRADEHEGTVAVQNMWAEAIARWDHLPLEFYVDNGSGHKNRLMSDELTGFYARIGVSVIHAIPGNPHGKGWIERFFRTVRDDFLKMWKPHLYCGADMAPEALNRTYREATAGRLALPSLAEFSAAFNAWIARYVNRPHPEEPNLTIAQVWAGLAPVSSCMSLVELERQAVLLTVSRGRITHGPRVYGHADLYAFNGQKLVLEYDVSDDRVAVIRTPDGALVCNANLVVAMDVRDPNRLEEKRRQRTENQIKRGERKLAEMKDRAGRVIDADAIADGVALEGEAARRLPDDGDDEIKLFDF